MIPKIIWQTHEWKYEDLPENFRGTIKTWKNLNPEWEHRYVDASQRAIDVKKYNRLLYRYYALADGVTQADIWRYVIIYTDGGVYADMDSICTMPLDYMIEKYYNGEDTISLEIMSENPNFEFNEKYGQNGVNNSNFAAVKNSKIMKMIIDNIINKYRKITLLDVFNTCNFEDKIDGQIKCLSLYYEMYSDVVMNNQKEVCFNFKASTHSKDFKEKFDSDYWIDNYGEQISYFSFIREKNLELY